MSLIKEVAVVTHERSVNSWRLRCHEQLRPKMPDSPLVSSRIPHRVSTCSRKRSAPTPSIAKAHA